MEKQQKAQKSQKRQTIMDAAYRCFLRNGVQKTSIDEIVQEANVAKGTFYLYFKDKADLSQQLFITTSCHVILQAFRALTLEERADYDRMIVGFADNIFDYFIANQPVLLLLGRNFVWPRLESLSQAADAELAQVRDSLLRNPHHPENDRETNFKYLYSIVVLCGEVGYSSIVHQQPDTIENMKPVLYEIIRRIVH